MRTRFILGYAKRIKCHMCVTDGLEDCKTVSSSECEADDAHERCSIVACNKPYGTLMVIALLMGLRCTHDNFRLSKHSEAQQENVRPVQCRI